MYAAETVAISGPVSGRIALKRVGGLILCVHTFTCIFIIYMYTAETVAISGLAHGRIALKRGGAHGGGFGGIFFKSPLCSEFYLVYALGH